MHVTTRNNTGGVSQIISSLWRDDSIEQVYVTGVCGANEKEMDLSEYRCDSKRKKFYQIQTLRREVSPLGDFLSLLTILRIFLKEKPDVIHTHMSKAGLLGRIASTLLLGKAKTVHSFHGHVLDAYFPWAISRVLIIVERILGRLTHSFIFDSNATMKEVNEYGISPKRNQLVIIPGLIESHVLNQSIPNRDHDGREYREKKTWQILVVARIEPIKRIDRVLEVARLLKSLRPEVDFEVSICGDGSLKREFEIRSESEELPIRFCGWQENLTAYYARCDVLLSVSDSEGTPISLMEAAVAGCPIVTTNVGGVSEIVEDGKTGYLCRRDPHDLTEKLVKLFDDPNLLSTISRAARTRAARNFLADTFRERHREVYKSITASSLKEI